MKRRFYDVCPICGATLDPGEKCNCEKEEENREYIRNIIADIGIPGIIDSDDSDYGQTTSSWSDI